MAEFVHLPHVHGLADHAVCPFAVKSISDEGEGLSMVGVLGSPVRLEVALSSAEVERIVTEGRRSGARESRTVPDRPFPHPVPGRSGW